MSDHKDFRIYYKFFALSSFYFFSEMLRQAFIDINFMTHMSNTSSSILNCYHQNVAEVKTIFACHLRIMVLLFRKLLLDNDLSFDDIFPFPLDEFKIISLLFFEIPLKYIYKSFVFNFMFLCFINMGPYGFYLLKKTSNTKYSNITYLTFFLCYLFWNFNYIYVRPLHLGAIEP